MAKKQQHVWGVEIGQSSLKALRCHLEGDQIVADTFDFVEYPKILSQPEAEPEALIADALQQFISRNDLKGLIKIGISVPGQSGLAKFFKPPPVEVKKIADIVKYEAKQQIPFDLNDVIWDFQQMEGAQIEDGYALESEVGLFAMKKEAVFRAMKPFRDVSMDIDLVQLAPMCIYNAVTFDRFAEMMATESFDPDHPQKGSVILSIGTDASDLIVSNGFRVWQRSIPIGGNHFTRQLTKDLKLTFAKAEHLKRNAMQADDPKLIFQAMRPVFNDLVTEIQRSLNFFKSLNKKSELEGMLLMGNTAKMPGLQQFLNKNLGMDVEILDKYPKLNGNEVLGALPFKENAAAFGVVYGLCLQLLSRGPMRTNLLPREIVIDRVVRMKKPWTVGALSLLLIGMVSNHAMMGQVYSRVRPEIWKESEGLVSTVDTASENEKKKDGEIKGKLALYKNVGSEVSKGAKHRVLCLELFKIVESCTNRGQFDPLHPPSPTELPYKNRKDFHITKVEQKYEEKLENWYKDARKDYLDCVVDRKGWGLEIPNRAATIDPDPSGPGWVIEICGYHYYNGVEKGADGAAHVIKTMIQHLDTAKILLPDEKTGDAKELAFFELGVRRPVLRNRDDKPIMSNRIENPAYLEYLEKHGGPSQPTSGGRSGGKPSFGGAGGGGGGGAGVMSEDSGPTSGSGGGSSGATNPNEPPKDENGKLIPKDFEAPRFNFIVQFAWKPRDVSGKLPIPGVAGAVSAPAPTAPAAPVAPPANPSMGEDS